MLKLRPADASDVGVILRLIHGLAEYEKAPGEVKATEADLLRDGFGSRPMFHVVLAEWAGTPVGFAFYFFNYSTWQGRPGLYLEDLFVLERARRSGAGGKLFEFVRKLGEDRGCGRMDWNVLDWNTPARDFYDRRNAQFMKEWLLYRLTY